MDEEPSTSRKTPEKEQKVVATSASRKRRASRAFQTIPKTTQNLRLQFDKELFVKTLKVVSKCKMPKCDPLFRRVRNVFNSCDVCWEYVSELHRRLVFTEELDKLREHACKAFEYVAQIASNLECDASKDKRVLSFLHVQNLIKMVSVMLKHVCQISDLDFEKLAKCSQITFLLINYNLKKPADNGQCQLEGCSNIVEFIVTVKEECYNPQTFKPTESSNKKFNYYICKLHTHNFQAIHKLQHVFYNSHQNFSYWIQKSKDELHESFDSKLKMDFTMDFNDDQKLKTGTASFLGIEQEVLRNFTDDLVNTLVELDCRLPGSHLPSMNKKLWASQVVMLKSRHILELAQKMVPHHLKKYDDVRASNNLSTRRGVSHLIYKDPD